MIYDIVLQFIKLGYKPGKIPSREYDIPIKDKLSIIRTGGYYTKILFLYNGANLSIVWTWIDLFESLSIWGREQIYYNNESNLVDKFIINMLHIIDATHVSVVDEDILKTIESICEIGTKPFKTWCNEQGFNELSNSLKPFEFISVNK